MAFDPQNIKNSTKIRNAPTNLQDNWLAIRGEDATYDPYVLNLQDRTPLVPGTVASADPAPMTSPTEGMRIYCKQDDDNNQQLYARDPSGVITQLTGGGTNLPGGGYANNGETSLVGGLLIKWALTPLMAVEALVQFDWQGTGSNQLNLTNFPNNVFNVQITEYYTFSDVHTLGFVQAYDTSSVTIKNGNRVAQKFIYAIGN